MSGITSTHVLIFGIILLILLVNERLRLIATAIVFIIVLLAAADVFGVGLST